MTVALERWKGSGLERHRYFYSEFGNHPWCRLALSVSGIYHPIAGHSYHNSLKNRGARGFSLRMGRTTWVFACIILKSGWVFSRAAAGARPGLGRFEWYLS